MDKNLKSLIGSLAFLFIYFYATYGIIKLIVSGEKRILFYTFLTVVLLLFVSLLLIVVTFHTLPPSVVTIIYNVIIYFHFIYLIVGSSINFLSK